MRDALRLAYARKMLEAVAATLPEPTPAQASEIAITIRNWQATGTPYQDATGAEMGIVYEEITL